MLVLVRTLRDALFIAVVRRAAAGHAGALSVAAAHRAESAATALDATIREDHADGHACDHQAQHHSGDYGEDQDLEDSHDGLFLLVIDADGLPLGIIFVLRTRESASPRNARRLSRSAAPRCLV